MFRTTEDLIPNVIRRRQNRSRPYATIIGIDGSRQSVSFADLENLSNRASLFLEGIASDQVFYMGPNDIRYAIWLIAAIKTGKCVVFPSLANQVPANQRFFETVGCKILLYAPEAEAALKPLLTAISGTDIECIISPTYGQMMNKGIVPVYPFDKTIEEVQRLPFLGLHTSGTSGHPKPIFWNHLAVSALASFLDPSIGAGADGEPGSSNLFRELLQENTVLLPFPLSHFGGMGNVMATIYSDTTLVLPAPGTRLSPDNITLLLQGGECTAAAVPPSLLESMLSYPPGMDVLARLKHIAYTGGPLNPIRGKALAEKLPHLFNVLASTEGGVSHLVSTGDSTRWDAFKFVDVGQRMEEVAPGIFELVFPRSELVDRTYAFFHTHPHLGLEFRTSDLLSPLEDERDGEGTWWVYRGRADNWIAMSNGLKMDPTEMENAIASHPDVTGVLMAGSHRFRLCLLIELAQKEHQQAHQESESQALRHEGLLEKIWPTIEAANTKVPKFGRVPKELVLFAAPDKPFLRAGKGTIQRRLTIQAYEMEIDELYTKVEEGLLIHDLPLPSSMANEDLMPFLERLCTETLLDGNTSDSKISVDDDLLALGLDSLSAFVLLARLRAVLRKSGVEAQSIQKIDSKLLYSATTIRQLASTLSQTLSAQTESSSGDYTKGARHHSSLSRLLEQYEAKVQGLLAETKKKDTTESKAAATDDKQVVLLTGSTGSLGSYILSSLLARPNITKIICVNRNAHSLSAQASSFRARGLADSKLHDNDSETRLQFLQADFSAPRFGLKDSEYAMLAREVTHIVHNAYPVNFLFGLDAFAPQFGALLNLMRLAAEAQNAPEIAFVSSITAATPVGGLHPGGTVDERVLDKDVADSSLLDQGYARSKYICERLLNSYTSISGNAASILRVGQVCGPVSGTGVRFWSTAEWLPSLVLSSKFIGAVPESLGGGTDTVDWVPVDKLGEIVCDLLGSRTAQPGESAGEAKHLRVINIVHPAATSWSALLPDVVRGIEKAAGNPVDIVSPSEWIRRLEASDHSPHVIRLNPAVKLIDFFWQTFLRDAGSVGVEVRLDNILKASNTARTLERINGTDMLEWMKGWGLR
ncbi:acetyl-CoA synthetase-like protein [Nemania sp. NC0429]|nr:acetyl-CoA synthetase-like protein [Nemania sp. NC0429]